MKGKLFLIAIPLFLLLFFGSKSIYAATCTPPGYCKPEQSFLGIKYCPPTYECAEQGGGSGDCGECGDGLRCCKLEDNFECEPEGDNYCVCGAGEICELYLVQSNYFGNVWGYHCVADTVPLCDNEDHCTPKGADFKCVLVADGCGNGWNYAPFSCGSADKECCIRNDATCPVPPAVCLPLSCPLNDYVQLSATCTGYSSWKCCYPKEAPIDDPTKPPEMVYKGPVIDTLDKIINPVTRILYYGGLFIGLFFIVYSGYKLMISQGNPQATQAAQEQLTSAILGIMFILLSAAILRIILNNIIKANITF